MPKKKARVQQSFLSLLIAIAGVAIIYFWVRIYNQPLTLLDSIFIGSGSAFIGFLYFWSKIPLANNYPLSVPYAPMFLAVSIAMLGTQLEWWTSLSMLNFFVLYLGGVFVAFGLMSLVHKKG